MNAATVDSVVATRNGGLFNSENGVFDMIANSRAGSDKQSRKKFIQARPDSGNDLALPQGETDEDQAEIRQRQIEDIGH